MNYSKEISNLVIRTRYNIQKKNRTKKIIISVCCIIAALIVIGVILANIFLSDRKKSEKSINNIPDTAEETTEISAAEQPVYNDSVKTSYAASFVSKKSSVKAVTSVSTGSFNTGKSTVNTESSADNTSSAALKKTEEQKESAVPSSQNVVNTVPSVLSDSDIYDRFISFEYDNSTYVSQSGKLFNEIISGKICDIMINGEEASLYRIEEISEKCAAAVRFSRNDNYFSYVSSSYVPAQLGDMLEEIRFDKYSVFHELTDTNSSHTAKSYDISTLVRIMYEHSSAEGICGGPAERIRYSISFMMPYFRITGKYLGITDDGYIVTDLFGNQLSFYIGNDVLQEFFDTLDFTN